MPVQVSMLGDAFSRIRRNRLALVGAGIIVLLLLTAILATFWTPYPTWLQAVGPTYQGPSAAHPLGLDQAGRDILSRIMGGASITVQVGIGSAIIVCLIGIPLGLLAGYYRGTVDTVISFFINIWYGIPDLLVALILVFVLSDALHLIPRGIFVIVLAFSLTRWMDVARLVRGQALALPLDVTDLPSIQATLVQINSLWGPVDLLVNNSGIQGKIDWIVNYDSAEWDRILAVNLRGPFLCCQATYISRTQRSFDFPATRSPAGSTSWSALRSAMP